MNDKPKNDASSNEVAIQQADEEREREKVKKTNDPLGDFLVNLPTNRKLEVDATFKQNNLVMELIENGEPPEKIKDYIKLFDSTQNPIIINLINAGYSLENIDQAISSYDKFLEVQDRHRKNNHLLDTESKENENNSFIRKLIIGTLCVLDLSCLGLMAFTPVLSGVMLMLIAMMITIVLIIEGRGREKDANLYRDIFEKSLALFEKQQTNPSEENENE